jgi:hypothetical protein
MEDSRVAIIGFEYLTYALRKVRPMKG